MIFPLSQGDKHYIEVSQIRCALQFGLNIFPGFSVMYHSFDNFGPGFLFVEWDSYLP